MHILTTPGSAVRRPIRKELSRTNLEPGFNSIRCSVALMEPTPSPGGVALPILGRHTTPCRLWRGGLAHAPRPARRDWPPGSWTPSGLPPHSGRLPRSGVVRPGGGSPWVGIGCVLASHPRPELGPPVAAGRAKHRWLLVSLLGLRGGGGSALGLGLRFPLLKRRRLLAAWAEVLVESGNGYSPARSRGIAGARGRPERRPPTGYGQPVA